MQDVPLRLADVTKAQLREAHALDYCLWLSCLATTRGAQQQASEIYLERFPRNVSASVVKKSLELGTKAATAPGTSTDGTWGGPLVGIQQLADGFAQIAHSASLLGRIPGLRKIPFNTNVPGQTAEANYQWVGENSVKPVSKLAFSAGLTLKPTKANGIIVLTKEFLKLTTPGTAQALQDTLISGLTTFVDKAFLSTAAAVAGTSPAGILNGTTPVAGTGNLQTDVKSLIAAFFAARPGAQDPVLIAAGGNAAAIRGMQPGFGLTVIASEAALTNVIMLDPRGVFYSDGGVSIDVSQYATLEMSDPATNPPVAATVMTSLFQQNLIGYLVERFVNFAAVTGAVKYLTTP